MQVKGRLNSYVNHEWMCDEGRYGFERFQPPERLSESLVREGEYLSPVSYEAALQAAATICTPAPDSKKAVFLSPFLTLEEIWVALQFAEGHLGLNAASGQIAMQLIQRELTELEATLISPDYAPNARAATLFGLGISGGDWRADLEAGYQKLLEQLRSGAIDSVLIVGQAAIRDEDLDSALIDAILKIERSVAISPAGLISGEEENATTPIGAQQLCSVVLASRTINEKNGVLVNQDMRFQKLGALLQPPAGTKPEWMILNDLASAVGSQLLPPEVIDDRAVFREMVKRYEPFHGLSFVRMGELGMSWEDLQAGRANVEATPQGGKGKVGADL